MTCLGWISVVHASSQVSRIDWHASSVPSRMTCQHSTSIRPQLHVRATAVRLVEEHKRVRLGDGAAILRHDAAVHVHDIPAGLCFGQASDTYGFCSLEEDNALSSGRGWLFPLPLGERVHKVLGNIVKLHVCQLCACKGNNLTWRSGRFMKVDSGGDVCCHGQMVCASTQERLTGTHALHCGVLDMAASVGRGTSLPANVKQTFIEPGLGATCRQQTAVSASIMACLCCNTPRWRCTSPASMHLLSALGL